MFEPQIPKAWDEIVNQLSFVPVITRTIEKLQGPNGWSDVLSTHDYFELIYVKKGNAVADVCGTEVSMGPNDLVIIKPEKQHRFMAKSENGCEIISLGFKFKSNCSDITTDDISIGDFMEYVNDENTGAFVFLRISRKNDIINVLNRILREKEKGYIWGEYLTSLLIMELFVFLSRAIKKDYEQSAINKSLKIDGLLSLAKEFIENNYEKAITLTDMANYIYLSNSYFAHTFSKKFGVSPKNYLITVRLNAAKELLVNTEMKIGDIALKVGFPSQQRFNDMFRKYSDGMTPFKYRKIERSKKLSRG